jgi:hypothetical protein
MADEPRVKKSKWRTPTALVVTALWLSLAVWWTFYRPSESWVIPAMDPNAWGDWAAGTFAPLAFLWLVVGYFQQGDELRESSRALHLQEKALQLQVQELKESVAQQTQLAKAANIQAELLEKSSRLSLRGQLLPHQPRITHFMLEKRPINRRRVELKNENAPCTEVQVRLYTEDGALLGEAVSDMWGTGGHVAVEFDFSEMQLPINFRIVIRYTDELGIEQRQTFTLKVVGKGQSLTAVVLTARRNSFNLPPAEEQGVE